MATEASSLVKAGVQSVEGTSGGARAVALARQRETDRTAMEQKRAEIAARNTGELPTFTKATKGKPVAQKAAARNKVCKTKPSITVQAPASLHLQAPLTAAAKIAAGRVGGVKRHPQPTLSFMQDSDEDDDFGTFQSTSQPKRGASSSISNSTASGPAVPTSRGAAAAGASDRPAEQASHHAAASAVAKRARLGKDPRAATDFLPDADRAAAEAATVQALKDEWKAAQEVIKAQPLRVAYSYYDGTGHRRSAVMKKGDSVATFLYQVQKDMAPLFPELKRMGVDALLYIKEDLILPHNITFYELIVTKARGKSGPLFLFDVSEDIRLSSDPRVEVKESHPGKVVQRKWYDANKHIFPASRWSVYDPAVTYDSYSLRK